MNTQNDILSPELSPESLKKIDRDAQAEAEAWFQTHKAKFPKVPPQLRLQVIQIVPAASPIR